MHQNCQFTFVFFIIVRLVGGGGVLLSSSKFFLFVDDARLISAKDNSKVFEFFSVEEVLPDLHIYYS